MGSGAARKGLATPWSVEGSSRIRGEVMDTVILILGSSQEEMMMSASGSEDTSYLSSVTNCEVQTQHKPMLVQLRSRCEQAGVRLSARPRIGRP